MHSTQALQRALAAGVSRLAEEASAAGSHDTANVAAAAVPLAARLIESARAERGRLIALMAEEWPWGRGAVECFARSAELGVCA